MYLKSRLALFLFFLPTTQLCMGMAPDYQLEIQQAQTPFGVRCAQVVLAGGTAACALQASKARQSGTPLSQNPWALGSMAGIGLASSVAGLSLAGASPCIKKLKQNRRPAPRNNIERIIEATESTKNLFINSLPYIHMISYNTFERLLNKNQQEEIREYLGPNPVLYYGALLSIHHWEKSLKDTLRTPLKDDLQIDSLIHYFVGYSNDYEKNKDLLFSYAFQQLTEEQQKQLSYQQEQIAVPHYNLESIFVSFCCNQTLQEIACTQERNLYTHEYENEAVPARNRRSRPSQSLVSRAVSHVPGPIIAGAAAGVAVYSLTNGLVATSLKILDKRQAN